MIKRLLDFIASALALIVLAPLFIVIGLAVLVDSGQPVLFRQQRIGRNGRPFAILKFRTMSSGPADGPLVTSANDPRVTRVGARLRSTKLDELPQLWNVLVGDLSLVGPRPEVPKYVALWPRADREVILSVRPGITDPASQKYRREAEMLAQVPDPERHYELIVLPDKVRIYRAYAENRTGSGDIRLLVGTLYSVTRG